MSVDAERAAVWKAIKTTADRLTALQAKIESDTVPAQLDAIREDLEQGRARFERIEGALQANTKLTQSVADVMTQHSELLADIARAQVFARATARAFGWVVRNLRRVVVWLGGLAGAAYAIYHALYALTHGGKGPS